MTLGTKADQPTQAGAGSDPPVALETYAAICAEVDAGVLLHDVLERENIDEQTWATAHAHWLRRMGDEADRKMFRVTTRYQAMFKAKRSVFDARLRRDRARAERSKIEAPPTQAMDAAERELRAPLVSALPLFTLPDAPPATRAPSPPLPVPSGMIPAERGASPIAPPPVFVAPPAVPVPSVVPTGSIPIQSTQPPSTARGGSAAGQSLPFVKPPGTAIPIAPAEIRTSSKPAWASMTADISAALRPPSAVPFKQDQPLGRSSLPSPSPPAPVAPIAPVPPIAPVAPSATAPPIPPTAKPKHLYATMGVDMGSLDLSALPFAASLVGKATPPPPPPPPLPFNNDPQRTGTIDPSIVANAIAGATPFKKPASSAPAPPPPIDDDPSVDSTRTQALPPETAQAHLGNAHLGKTAPSQPPVAAAPSRAVQGGTSGNRFPINVFASLTAEIAESPTAAFAIRGRYGITEAEHHEESQRWTTAFEKDPALRERYFGIVKRYRAYLQNTAKK